MISCTENYNDRLLDMKKVVFVTGGGVNDLVVSIAGCLTLIDHYCPNCEEISVLIFTASNFVKCIVDSEEFYSKWLNLPKMDSRLKYIGVDEYNTEEFGKIHSPEHSFYEDSKELQWNYFSSEPWVKTKPLYIDKINKVLYISVFIVRDKQSKIKLLNWNVEIKKKYWKKIINCYKSQITTGLQEFINNENLKDCIGLHLRLDNHWPEWLERIIYRTYHYDVINNIDKEYNHIDNIINNMRNNIASCNEITNSHIRNYERFIFEKEKEGIKIFFASDCPVTANYFSKKYSNVIQYEKYEISNFYRHWFFNEDILEPYGRKNDYFSLLNDMKDQSEFKYIGESYNRCLYDYICLINCGPVFFGSGGFSNYLQEKCVEGQFHLGIEDEIMENYSNIGI